MKSWVLPLTPTRMVKSAWGGVSLSLHEPSRTFHELSRTLHNLIQQKNEFNPMTCVEDLEISFLGGEDDEVPHRLPKSTMRYVSNVAPNSHVLGLPAGQETISCHSYSLYRSQDK